MTTEEIEAIQQRREKASEMISALCKPRGTEGSREWIMSIPANRDRDPDLIFADVLRDVLTLLTEVASLKAVITEQEEQIESLENYAIERNERSDYGYGGG